MVIVCGLIGVIVGGFIGIEADTDFPHSQALLAGVILGGIAGIIAGALIS
jgi:hypothetical protein